MAHVSNRAPHVRESYRECARIAREEARNFYYSFLALPPEKHAAMCAVYAWMRHADDISDGDAMADTRGDRAAVMQGWRAALDRALAGDYGDSRVLPALHDAIRGYCIPAEYFHQLITGAEMDLSPRRYETFADLREYCYHVASVVGLVCVHIFGFREARALDLAVDNGIAFQLTNILRDLQEDAERGRVYLPQEDLRRFDYSEDDLRRGRVNEAFLALMRFETERAEEHYRRAAPLVGLIDADARPCLRAMCQIYHGILEQIVAQGYDVFSRRARLPTWAKWRIAGGAWLQSRLVRRSSASPGGGEPSSV